MIRPSKALWLALLLAGFAVMPAAAVAQDDEPEKSDEPEEKDGTPKKADDEKAPKKEGKVKPYDEVITEDAESDAGIFTVHRLDGKVFFEIPVEALDSPLIWVTQIAQTSAGRDIMGTLAGDLAVRWEFREADETILLREVDYAMRAEDDDPIYAAVESSSLAPIIRAFPVAAYGKDKAMVVDVTDLFVADVPEISVKDRLGAAGIDRKRTFIDQVKSFPENIEARVLATFNPKGEGGGGGPFGGGGADTITALVHHSMVKLPDDPMLPRRLDDRVGFFSVGFTDYSSGAHEVKETEYITRWRLEKKDPDAEVSEPVEPIVFYIGREVPDLWRPYVKQGIEAWQAAFEKAGFKDAVIAKDAPSYTEDPDWDPEDARYSSIRWLPTTVENAMGPHVHDPRTGEILEADIQMYHNVIKLARDWYFVQASPNDEDAQKLPLSDELMGELIAYVVSHEVGHTLGFPHNMKASSSYTVEELRDEEFTEKNGTEASIMDYGRFNYVAQPGDGARLIPIIGPYDEFAVEWGYREFLDAETFEEEKEELDKLVARQRDDPKLRFGDPNAGEDPSQQTEDLGSDPVAATEMGLKNLERVAGYLVEATSEEGENYDLLRNMYGQLVAQLSREMGHVANVVGGFVRDNVYYGDADRQYNAVPAEQQKAAVAFLNEHAFNVPGFLLEADVLRRLEADGAADRILGMQRSLLNSLMRSSRLGRMAEQAAVEPGDDAYLPIDLLVDLTDGIFSEIADDGPAEVDLYRRNLQRAYVDMLIEQVKADSAPSDLPALARGELRRLADHLDGFGNPKGTAPTTRYHLQDLHARIVQALDPRGSLLGVGVAGD